MIDKHARNIEYLRISLTEKCNLRCIYCNPQDANECSNEEILSADDFYNIVKNMTELGIRKVRLTGGEPLVRKDICEIVEIIAKIEGIDEVALTTNGVYLEKYAESLKRAGLNRVNISLDTLDEEKFKRITNSNVSVDKVFRGIESAIKVGLLPIRLNVVLIRGENDNEIDDFINLTKDMQVSVRFIELMPFNDNERDNSKKIVYNNEIIESHPQLKKYNEIKGGPAQYYSIEGHKGLIGFISPMSHKFCNSCNRIRLTSDGKIIPCLGKTGEVDILEVIKEGNSEKLKETIKNAIYNKPEGHCFVEGFTSERKMNKIGG